MAPVIGQLIDSPELQQKSSSAEPVLVADKLTRRFGDRTVLDGIDLTIGRGEFVALLGRSGSGKSTLLRAVAGLDVGVDGTGDLFVARNSSVVFQDSRLLPWSRVLPNVTLGLSGRDAAEAGRTALADVGLAQAANGPGPPNSPVANSNVWRWPDRLCASPSCCLPTSRSERSTPSPASACTACCASCAASTGPACCWSPTTSTRRSPSPTGSRPGQRPLRRRPQPRFPRPPTLPARPGVRRPPRGPPGRPRRRRRSALSNQR